MEKQMIEGNPLKQILKFTWPLLLGNLFQQTYNLADAAIVGKQLGKLGLGAVGVSSSVQFLVLGFCIGVAAGFAIPVATEYGAKNYKDMQKYIYNGSFIVVSIALAVTLITSLSVGGILNLIKTPADIYHDAYDYLLIIFLGLPFTLLYNYLSGLLRSVGDSKTPFYFLTLSSILNIVLDILFIINLKWGVKGAAFATVLSQVVSCVGCFIVILKKVKVLHVEKENRKMEKQKVNHLLNMGIPMGFQMSITAIGSMVMQTANNSLGTTYISAFAAGIKVKQFGLCAFDALATAVSTFISQNVGAKRIDRVKEGLKIGNRVATIYGITIGLLFIVFRKPLSLIFLDVNDVAVVAACEKYLASIGSMLWIVGVLIVTRAAAQGMGWSKRAVVAGFVEMGARTAVALIFTPIYGYTAICFTDQAAWIAGAIYISFVAKHAIESFEKKEDFVQA